MEAAPRRRRVVHQQFGQIQVARAFHQQPRQIDNAADDVVHEHTRS
jgi:hypothetical protein